MVNLKKIFNQTHKTVTNLRCRFWIFGTYLSIAKMSVECCENCGKNKLPMHFLSMKNIDFFNWMRGECSFKNC